MPHASRFLRFRILAPPVALAVVVFALFAGYRAVHIASDRDGLRTETSVLTEQTAIRLEETLGARLQMTLHLRDHGVRSADWNEETFRDLAEGVRSSFPGIVAVNWVDRDGVIRWVVPEAPNLAAKGRDLDDNPLAAPALAKARAESRLAVTRPLELYQGGRGFAAYVPVVRGGTLAGFVNIAFRTEPLVGACLARGVRGTHEAVVEDDGAPLFRSAPDGGAGFGYRVARDIVVGDRTWRMVLWPRDEVVAAATGGRHDVLLVLGAVFGIGLAFSMFWVTRSRVRLARSEEAYRNILEDTPALVCRFRPDGRITFVNGAFAAAFARDPGDLVGGSILDLVPEEGRERFLARIAGLGPATPFVRREHRMIRHDGGEVWVGWAERALLDDRGQVVEIQAIGLDATEPVRAREALRQSERRFRTIVNSVNEAILLVDADGTVFDVNDRACEMFARPREAIVGAPVARLSREGGPGLAHALDRIRGEGDAVSPFAWTVRGPDGPWHAEVELRGVEIDGEIRAVAVVRDVTARVRLEEQLQQSQKMEAMGTLATGVAHDFNNVLTAILGHAEIARTEIQAGTRAAHAVDGVLTACDQAVGVTRSLLTFGRRAPAHPVPTDLTEVVRTTLDLLRPLLPDAIDVVREIPLDRPLWIHGDAAQMQQVLLNLALNARDAMPGGGRLTVALREETHDPDDPAARRVVLQVADSGTGMTEEVRSRVIEPFFTTKPRERGTGLGMAVVHGIVTAHRGDLRIDSRTGHGTCVTVRLPACAPSGEAAIESSAAARGVADGARILLVEDNDQVRGLLERALADRGFAVTAARDGVEAVERYDGVRGRFDLLLFDVDLPRMSGTACLDAIRERGGEQPAILISGNPEIDVATDGPGVVRFLAKPFRMDVVAALIEELL